MQHTLYKSDFANYITTQQSDLLLIKTLKTVARITLHTLKHLTTIPLQIHFFNLAFV